MIRTSTQRSSVNATRVRDAFYQTLTQSSRYKASAFNPELELGPTEAQSINEAMLSLSEGRIAEILAQAARV